MTRDVTDAANIMNVISGHDMMDSTSSAADVPDFTQALTGDVKGMKIGLPKEYFGAGIAPEVATSVKAAIEQLTKLGAEVTEISLPHTEYAVSTYYLIAPAEAATNLARYDGVSFGARVEGADIVEMMTNTRTQKFGPEVKRRIMIGNYALSAGYYDAYYGKAQRVRTLIKRDFDEVFAKCDALITPCAPTPAFRFKELQDPLTMYLNDLFTIPSALAGVCASSVPAGFTSGKLPVGIQLICGSFEEAKLLRVSKAFEDLMK
mgnify:CR=1 FL=1